MAENSGIQWTTHTFNPWRGCTKVSPGCANCYAEALSARNPAVLGKWGPEGTRVIAAEAQWRLPRKWNSQADAENQYYAANRSTDPPRPRVFCASLADVFEGPDTMNAVSWGAVQEARKRLFGCFDSPDAGLIEDTPNLDWLLLTKRPENVGRILNQLGIPGWWNWIDNSSNNVWLGTSVEDRKHGLPRIDILRTIPAAVRFLSVEPLLEDLGRLDLTGIHWVIVGGESGPKARPMHPAWVKSIRDQCNAAGVPFFYKQWGEYAPEDALPPMRQGESRKFQLVRPDGGNRIFAANGTFSGDSPQQEDAWMYHVGKKAAGRTLDGRTWDEFPIANH